MSTEKLPGRHIKSSFVVAHSASFLSVVYVLSIPAMQKAYLVFRTMISLVGSAVFRMRLLGQDVFGSVRKASVNVDCNSASSPLCSFLSTDTAWSPGSDIQQTSITTFVNAK